MNFDDFSKFYDSTFEHNFKVQKQLEKEGHVLTNSKLKEFIKEFPLAQIYLHYPHDQEVQDLTCCYSVSYNSPLKLFPVLSAYLSDDKIILSYLSQQQLEKLNFEADLPVTEHYMNSASILKYFFNDFYKGLSHQDHSMIFFEYISDDLCWKSDSPYHKIHEAYSLIGLHHFMLWEGSYFSSHT